MDRSIPVFNRIVVFKTQQKNHELHLRRLSEIRSNQRKAFTSMRNTQYNPKRQQLEQERKTEIEKQNVLLYNKMSKILNRSRNKSQSFHIPLREQRIKNLNRIHEENKQISKRLENQKPTISNKKMYQQRMEKEKLLGSIGVYPYRQRIQSAFNSSLSIEQKRSIKTPSTPSSRRSKLQKRFQRMQQSFYRKSELPAVKQTMEFPSRQCHTQQAHQSINLYKKRMIINGFLCAVQINRLHHHYEFKLTDDTQKTYILKLPELQGNKVLSDFDYDFGFIASCLKISQNKLHLNIDKQRQETPRSQFGSQIIPKRKQLVNQAKLKNFKLQQEVTEEDRELNLEQKRLDFSQNDLFFEDEMQNGFQEF